MADKTKEADKKLTKYYAKLQSNNRVKQAVCNGSQNSEKLRKRAALENS